MRAASSVPMGATSYEQGEVAPKRATKRIGSYETTKEEGLCEKFNELRELHIKKGAVKILTIEGSYV